MQQKKTPHTVISTGNQYSVKQFVNLVLRELNIKYFWKGKGIKSKCYNDKGKCIIECDKTYIRPLEVDTLLGNSNKAKKELKWKPKVSINQIVKEMDNFKLKNFLDDII